MGLTEVYDRGCRIDRGGMERRFGEKEDGNMLI